MRSPSLATFFIAVAAGAASINLVANTTFAQTSQPVVTLHVADQIPPLQVTRWIKGTPVSALEPGKTYVIEFWATWCVPCKKAIPHLTELARKYDQATFVGVDVLEHPGKLGDEFIAAKVVPFVQSMGDSMGYSVAADGMAAKMAATWIDPAGQMYIPATFLIDGKGRLAWIGHPDNLEPVLIKVLDGTWDINAERKRNDTEQAVERPRVQAWTTVMTAAGKNDFPAVLIAVDKAIAAVPELARDQSLISSRMRALLETDASKALAFAKASASPSDHAAKISDISPLLRVIPEISGKSPMTQADWKSLAAIFDPIVTSAPAKSGDLSASYANLRSRAGDRDAAITYMARSVELTKADSLKDEDHAAYYAELLKNREAMLAALQGSTTRPSASQQ